MIALVIYSDIRYYTKRVNKKKKNLYMIYDGLDIDEGFEYRLFEL